MIALQNFLKSNVGILSSKLFLAVLVLKIISSFLFASDFLSQLFARFVNYYVVSGFQNPYRFFYQIGELTAFPYPKIMLWLLAFPRWLFSPFLSADYNFVSNLHLFVYRLPLLAADIAIFFILLNWLKNKKDKVLKYYWCSPILFYISYIHGQLDVLPIAFLFVFLLFLFQEKLYWAFIFLGLAISAKTSIALVLPFAIIYLILKRIEFKQIAVLSFIPLAIFAVINFNYWLSSGFSEIVLHNKEQIKIFDFNYRISDDFILYFAPLAYLILLVRSLTYKTFNRDIFLMFLGFSFGIIVLFVPPMQGWYYWIIPFFIYFYIVQEKAPKFTFIILNVFYFLYFFLMKNSDFPDIFQFVSKDISALPNAYHFLANRGFNASQLSNIAFTLLQTALILNIVWIYRRGIESNIQHKIKYQPYLIGLAGDSGSGKTTITNLIKDVFGEKDTAILQGDDMHKWERGHPMWSELTHLNPKANKLHDELKNILHLKKGNAIERRHYDHYSGNFTLPKKLESKKIILLEGLHSLFLNQMRNVLDLKIFINPDEQLRLHWKILRDMEERGHGKGKIIRQIKKRESDSKQYIQTQEQHADICISLRSEYPIKKIGNKDAAFDVYLEFKCVNDINFEPLLNQLAIAENLNIEHLFYDKHQLIQARGGISSGTINKIASYFMPDIQEIIIEESNWKNNYNGLIQLFICYYIFEKMRMENK